MIKKYINKDIFSENIDMSPIRAGYGEGLLKAGERDKNVVALCADLTESTKTDKFKNSFPDRFVEVGVAEQSMASVASGMAAMGKVPFFTSYAMFSPGRNWEQIRTTICYNDVNAKIVGSHAGVSVGPDGGTHQALEDVAITRVIPRMTVIAPCDSLEAEKATIAAAEHKGAVYLRLQREATPIMTTSKTPFKIGKVQVFYESPNPKILICSYGGVLYNSIIAAKELESKGTGSIVLNVSTIKPLDEEIINFAKDMDAVVVVEEHQRAGGLGSSISELLSENSPIKIIRIGVDDKFGQSGDPDELIKAYGFDSDSIVSVVESSL